MLFHPAKVPLKVFSISFTVYWACCANWLKDFQNTFDQLKANVEKHDKIISNYLHKISALKKDM